MLLYFAQQGVRPYISVFKNDLGSVPIGYFAYYTIIIKTNPGDTIPYLLNVSTSAVGYGVCTVRVIKVRWSVMMTTCRVDQVQVL